jgi:uracil-DNA glycosylase family 4
MESLEDVARLVKNCTDCPLHNGRTNAVPGEGNSQADIMFIGEGPGFREDREGRPFVGPAGQLLEGLLASIGTNRNEVFIANMVKCRPPDNRDPAPPEIAACSKYLDRQIELINPKLIVTLGRFSLGRFSPGESITRVRGKVRQKDGRMIFPVLHPAAVLRRQELRGIMVEDFQAISRILEDGHGQSPVSVPLNTELVDQQPTAQPEQLTFTSAPNTAVNEAPPVENPVEGLNEAAQPEQLTLF